MALSFPFYNVKLIINGFDGESCYIKTAGRVGMYTSHAQFFDVKMEILLFTMLESCSVGSVGSNKGFGLTCVVLCFFLILTRNINM